MITATSSVASNAPTCARVSGSLRAKAIDKSVFVVVASAIASMPKSTERRERKELRKQTMQSCFYLLLDTETGGLSKKTDAVIQLGALILNDKLDFIYDKNGAAVFNSYIYPPKHLLCRIGALKSTGIDMMKVLTAPEEHVVAIMFRQFLDRFAPITSRGKHGCPIVAGYNVGFDWGFLEEIQERTGEKFNYFQPEVPPEGLSEPPFVDILKLARKRISKKVLPNHQLRTVAGYFRSQHTNSHDALEDCLATLDAWRGLVAMEAA